MLENLLLFYHYLKGVCITIITFLYILVLLMCHGDIEANSGPKKLKNDFLSVCHRNLNNLSSHKFSKLTQLKAYISVYKYDFICLSETYLDSSTPDGLLDIDGDNLVRADRPNNIEGRGVWIYYKESLHVRVISLPYVKEALLLEMTHSNKKVIVSVIYRSSSQNNSELYLFLSNFEKLLSSISKRKPSLSVITGEFNARPSSWWPKDISTTEESKLFSLTSSNWFHQLINEPTHKNKQLFLY